MSYIIKDWAGNTCFHGKTFKSFDDAEEYLSLKFEHLTDKAYNEERGEYWIQHKDCTSRDNCNCPPCVLERQETKFETVHGI